MSCCGKAGWHVDPEGVARCVGCGTPAVWRGQPWGWSAITRMDYNQCLGMFSSSPTEKQAVADAKDWMSRHPPLDLLCSPRCEIEVWNKATPHERRRIA